VSKRKRPSASERISSELDCIVSKSNSRLLMPKTKHLADLSDNVSCTAINKANHSIRQAPYFSSYVAHNTQRLCESTGLTILCRVRRSSGGTIITGFPRRPSYYRCKGTGRCPICELPTCHLTDCSTNQR